MELLPCCLLMTMLGSNPWVTTIHAATLPSPASRTERAKEVADSGDDDGDADGDGRGRDRNGTDRREIYGERLIGGTELSDPADKTACTLRAYDADRDLETIRRWHDLIKAPVDASTAMRQLLVESCDDEERDVMCNTFLFARRERKPCPSGLTSAECLAVTMYSAEVAGGFYRVFNNASAYGVWEPYRVYTSLLYAAVRKLAAIEPVPVGAKLYRGMSLACRPPDARRIFWKTFTSTTLDEEIAGYFGSMTSLVFEGQATLVGARIKNLSLIEMEEEVLIPPFETFDFLKADKQTFYFSSSKEQELLRDGSSCSVQVSLLAATLSVVSAIVSTSPI